MDEEQQLFGKEGHWNMGEFTLSRIHDKLLKLNQLHEQNKLGSPQYSLVLEILYTELSPFLRLEPERKEGKRLHQEVIQESTKVIQSKSKTSSKLAEANFKFRAWIGDRLYDYNLLMKRGMDTEEEY